MAGSDLPLVRAAWCIDAMGCIEAIAAPVQTVIVPPAPGIIPVGNARRGTSASTSNNNAVGARNRLFMVSNTVRRRRT